MKTYPIDLPGAKRMGIESWLESFSCPIPGEEHLRVHQQITAAFSHALPDADALPAAHWAVVVNYKLIPFMAQCHFDFLKLRRLKAEGYDSVAGQEPVPIDDALAAKKLAVPLNPKTFAIDPALRLKERLRTVKVNQPHHSALSSVFHRLARHDSHMVGDRNQKELRAYLADTGLNPFCLRPLLYLNPRPVERAQGDAVRKLVAELFNNLLCADRGFQDCFDNAFRQRLEDYLLATVAVFNGAREALGGRPLPELLVTHMGNLPHRVFAAAWRSLGGEVTGFSHGNPYPYSYIPGDAVNGARMIFSKYSALSEGERRLLEAARRDFGGRFASTDKIEVHGGGLYAALFEAAGRAPRPTRTKSVMVVGFPFDYFYSAQLPELNTMSYLAFELEIVKTLKDAGHTVVYKAHPDTLKETSGIFERFADRVETKPFEAVVAEADCLLFPHPFSTTLGYSLMSNRPVTLMSDTLRCHWHPEVLPLLRKRCSLVEIAPGADGRVVFDPDELKRAVAESPERLDYAIVERFAL